MTTKIILLVKDGPQPARKVVVRSKRFTIGSAPDNNLILESEGVEDCHALISAFFGVACLSDRDSLGGTFVNGRRITRPVQLREGDVIGFGGSCKLQVRIRESILRRLLRSLGVAKVKVSYPMAAAAVLVVCAILAIIATLVGAGESDRSEGDGWAHPAKSEVIPSAPPADATARLEGAAAGGGEGGNDSPTKLALVEKAAVQVIRRVSRDELDYSFDDQAVRDVSVKVDELSGSPLVRESLEVLSRREASIGAAARREGLEPGLILLLSLALTDGGRTGDPVAASRSALPTVTRLNQTLGSLGGDGSLIVVAAYPEGPGTPRSHPLLQRMRRIVKDPLAERNVWFLHRQGVIDDRAYAFVISFLAYGVVAQNPRQFGVEAEPLPF